MSETKYITIIRAAGKLGVPAAWLRKEAEAGRIPCVRAGRRILANPEAVEAALLARAKRGESEAAQ